MVVMQSFTVPTAGIRHKQCNVKAIINTREMGKGTLYITESLVSWGDENTLQGFSLQYPHITLHAVSKDPATYPQECLYIMLDTNIEKEDSDQESEHVGSEGGMTEIRFIPDDRGFLECIFRAMNLCQSFHPDPQDVDSDSGDGTFDDAELDERVKINYEAQRNGNAQGPSKPPVLEKQNAQENAQGPSKPPVPEKKRNGASLPFQDAASLPFQDADAPGQPIPRPTIGYARVMETAASARFEDTKWDYGAPNVPLGPIKPRSKAGETMDFETEGDNAQGQAASGLLLLNPGDTAANVFEDAFEPGLGRSRGRRCGIRIPRPVQIIREFGYPPLPAPVYEPMEIEEGQFDDAEP